MDNLILTDYIFLFITAVSTLFGFARGFLRELFTVLNLVLAVGAAYLLFPYAKIFFASHLKDELTIMGAAGLGSFVFSWILVAIINSFVIDSLKFMRGGFVDRIMGIALGLFRGALIVIGIYLGVTVTVNAQDNDDALPAWLKDAKSLNYIKVQSQYVVALMPKRFKDFYNNQDGSLSEALNDKVKENFDPSKATQLLDMGFDSLEIEDFQELLTGIDNSLSVEDMNDFSPSTIKMIGEQALQDYDLDGSAASLSQDKLNAIRKQLEKIKIGNSN